MTSMMSFTNMTFVNCSIDLINSSCSDGYLDNSTKATPVLKQGARTLFMIGLVLAWVNAVLTISLNSTVIGIICSYKKRSRLYFFLLNLAVADLAGGLFDALPHALERTLGLEYVVSIWLAGDTFCKIQRTVAQTCLTTSNYLLAVMSMDRAYVICKPMRNIKRGSILQKTIVVCCWLFCFLCNSPLLKFNEATNYDSRFSFSNKQQCIYNFGKHVISSYKTYIYLKFVFMFLVPLFIIMISYILLVTSIYRRSLSPLPSEKKPEITESSRLSMSRVFNGGVSKSKVKSLKLTLGIVLSFILCWMAYFTGYFLAIFDNFNHPTLLILTTFYYWNSIANPILFFVYHRKKVRSKAKNGRFYTYTSEPVHHSDGCVPTPPNHETELIHMEAVQS